MVKLYSVKELEMTLQSHTKRKINSRSVRRWRNELCIKPTVGNFFCEEDLTVLIRLVRWLDRGGLIEGFRSILLSELDTNDVEALDYTQTIDVL